MTENDNYALRFDDYKSNVESAWKDLQIQNEFCDVTLACEDKEILTHKMVLCSSSSVLRNILKQNTNKHPIIFIEGVKANNLDNLLNFMYQGEISIAEEDLSDFLKLAEDLEIVGPFIDNKNGSTINKKNEIEIILDKTVNLYEIIDVHMISKNEPNIQFGMAVKEEPGMDLLEKTEKEEKILDTDSEIFLDSKNGMFLPSESCHYNENRPTLKRKCIENKFKELDNSPPLLPEENIFLELNEEIIPLETVKVEFTENTISQINNDVYNINKSESINFQMTENKGSLSKRKRQIPKRKVLVENALTTEQENYGNKDQFFKTNNDNENFIDKIPQTIILPKENKPEVVKHERQISHEKTFSMEKTEIVKNIHKSQEIMPPEMVIKIGDWKQFACGKCEQAFKVKKHLFVHAQEVHDGVIIVRYTCRRCDFLAKSKDQLKVHVTTVHQKI